MSLGGLVAAGARTDEAVALDALGPVAAVWAANPVPVVQRNSPTAFEEVVLHPTLLNVENRIPFSQRPDGHPWYLWFWTHDAPIMRLYTAASPTGPFIDRGTCSFNQRPGPAEDYQPEHWACGDVGWDPQSGYFYSTPHSRHLNFEDGRKTPTHKNNQLNNSHQDTFLMRSRDGRNWELLSTTPILRHRQGQFDSRQATYARFMKDLDGNIARHNGQVALYFRGEYWLNDDASQIKYVLGCATASSPGSLSWNRTNGGNQLCNPLLGLIFGIGSAIYSGGQVTMVWAVGAGAPMFRKMSPAGDPFGPWANDPGLPMYINAGPPILGDGAAIVRNGTTQYAVSGGQWVAPVIGNHGVFQASGTL